VLGTTDPSDITPTLRAVSHFAGLDDAALADVARFTVRRRFDAEEPVIWEGDPGAGLIVVEQGWLKVVKYGASGREQVLRVVGPGEVFNEVSVLTGSPNMATVLALEPARVVVLPRDRMLDLLANYPAISAVVLRNLAERLAQLVTLVEDLSLRTVEMRFARLLLERSAGGVLRRQRWTTQAEMASWLGTVPDVLNRVMRELVEGGLIEVERRAIRILDRPALAARAAGGGGAAPDPSPHSPPNST